MSKQIEQFLQVLSPLYPMVFRTISKDGIPNTVNKDHAVGSKTENVYFLGGVKPSATRMTDHDIGIIHYIRLDIDIKKGVRQAMGVDTDQGDIEGFIDEIKDALATNEFLKDRSYIVSSGGGCHIYYSNTKGIDIGDDITPKIWQLAMKRIYELYDKTLVEHMGEAYTMLESDKAVCNTARIMRLPGTINQKHGVECRILYERPEQQSLLLSHVRALGLDAQKKKDQISKERAKEIELMRQELISNGGGDTDLKYAIINKFPAYIIAQILLPAFKYDGKKNFKGDGRLKGYYYNIDTNSICNGGSGEFAWGTSESCWNNFSLVQRQLNLSKADTFTWFEDKFNI